MTSVPTRPLGHSGLAVSTIGLGTNNFGRRLDLEATRAVLDAAIEHGVTFLDTADRYGNTLSEEYIGESLRGRRDEVVIATKFGLDIGDGWEGPRGRGDYIRHAVEGSLRRLQTDVIDVYWYHYRDGVTPIGDTLEALDALVKEGKVRALGTSNVTADELAEADRVARDRGLTRFTAVQNEYSLLARDAEYDVLPLCAELEVAFIPYFPLASGLLTGKYRRDTAAPAGTRLAGRDQIATAEQWDQIEALSAYAETHAITMTQVAIGSLLAQPAVASVIAGATSREQVAANAAAATWIPSPADLSELQAQL